MADTIWPFDIEFITNKIKVAEKNDILYFDCSQKFFSVCITVSNLNSYY
jgi:hypothetical protein